MQEGVTRRECLGQEHGENGNQAEGAALEGTGGGRGAVMPLEVRLVCVEPE